MGEIPGLVRSCVDVSWKKRIELGDVEWNPLEGFLLPSYPMRKGGDKGIGV